MGSDREPTLYKTRGKGCRNLSVDNVSTVVIAKIRHNANILLVT